MIHPHPGGLDRGADRGSPDRRILTTLAILLVLGLAARIAVTTRAGWTRPPIPPSDASEYDSYAWNLAQDKGFSGISPDVFGPDGRLVVHLTAYRSPGVPVYWAVLYKLFGHRVAIVHISQCVLDLLTILLVFGIGTKCFDHSVGLLAAGIYAVWPTALEYASELGSETQYTLLLSAAILLALVFAEQKTWAPAIAAGTALGLAMLTRGNAVLLVCMMFPWALWQFRRTPAYALRGFAIPLIAMALSVPWAIRNYAVFHAFIPFQTEGGDTLLGSHNRITAYDPEFYGYWIYPEPTLTEYTAQLRASNNEYLRDRVETRLAAQWLRSHPDTWWYFIQAKFRRSWTPFLQSHAPRLDRAAMLLSWGPVLLLFALGVVPSAVFFLRTNHPGWLLHLGILHFVLTAEIFYGASRFRFPVEPLCIVIACATLLWTSKMLNPRLRAVRGGTLSGAQQDS